MKGSTVAVVAAVIVALIVSFVALGLVYQQNQFLRAMLGKQSQEIQRLSSELSSVKSYVSQVSSGISAVKAGLSSVKGELSNVKSSVSQVRNAVEKVRGSVNNVEEKVGRLSTSITTVMSEVRSVSQALAKVSTNVTTLKSEISLLKEQVASMRYPLILTDALGRQVTIPAKPARIVSTAPSITEILFLVGAGKNVVGVDKYSNYPPIVKKLEKNGTIKIVGGFSTVNIEAILMLKPDIVFMTTGVQEKFARELAGMGITVFVLPSRSMADVFSDILTVGLITGHFDKALKVVQEMRNIITSTRLKVEEYLNKTGQKPVKVYYEIYPNYWTVGGPSFINDIITLAGGVNIFENESRPYFVASPEAVIAANPDVILMNYNYGYFGSVKSLIKKITSREGWANITAVKKGRIYVFCGVAEDIMDRPGPRAALAVALMARVLYPQAFGITHVPHAINETVMQEWGIPTSLG